MSFHVIKIVLLNALLLQSSLIMEVYGGDIEQAEGAYISGHFDQALKGYDQWLAQNPSDSRIPSAIYWRSRCLLALDRYPEAMEGFLKAMESATDLSIKDDARLGYADALYCIGELEGALAEYQKLLGNFHSVQASYLLYQIGLIWESRGNSGKSAEYFKNILVNFSESYEAALIAKKMPTASDQGYFVQVGVFQSKNNLERLMQRIHDLGYPCQVEEVAKPNGRVFKLKAGLFDREIDARRALVKIRERAQVEGHVVKG